MTTDTETFPTTTFDSVEFTGCGAIKANFKGELKFEIDNAPQALVQLQGLHTKKGKLVFISDQGQLPAEGGGNGSGDWANMDLQLDDEREVEYGRFCLGGECGHFCVPKEGDLANQFVCYKDPDALMVIVQSETLCPLGETDEAADDTEEAVGETGADDSETIPAEAETEDQELDRLSGTELVTAYRSLRDRFTADSGEGAMGAAEGQRFDALVDEIERRWPEWSEAKLDEVLRIEAGEPADEPMAARGGAVVLVVYPSDEEDADPHATPVGEHTRYSELVADFLAAAHVEEPIEFYEVSWSGGEDEATVDLPLDQVISGEYYGETLYVDRRGDVITCPTCDGDGRQPDKSGGGHHGVCSTCNGLGMALPEATAA